MNPAEFRDYAAALVRQEGYPAERFILGGDHLGPLAWTDLGAQEAMKNARDLIVSFVAAGYRKIHIDTSMRLANDDPDARLSCETIAKRAAQLCKEAEAAYAERKRNCPDAQPPIYVVGSEVPIPGGGRRRLANCLLHARRTFSETVDTFKKIFVQNGLEKAWARVAAVVVQPGVEFGDAEVKIYDPAAAADLVRALRDYPPMMFEGHSTDYQPRAALRAMVKDGIGILKVGPALTFALREALFALESIERDLPIPPGKTQRVSGGSGKGHASLARQLEEALSRRQRHAAF